MVNNKYDTISDALYNDTEMPTIIKCSIHKTVFLKFIQKLKTT